MSARNFPWRGSASALRFLTVAARTEPLHGEQYPVQLPVTAVQLTTVTRVPIFVESTPAICRTSGAGSSVPSGLRSGGFFLQMSGGRTAFVVDGFNVYHSLVEASAVLGIADE